MFDPYKNLKGRTLVFYPRLLHEYLVGSFLLSSLDLPVVGGNLEKDDRCFVFRDNTEFTKYHGKFDNVIWWSRFKPKYSPLLDSHLRKKGKVIWSEFVPPYPALDVELLKAHPRACLWVRERDLGLAKRAMVDIGLKRQFGLTYLWKHGNVQILSLDGLSLVNVLEFTGDSAEVFVFQVPGVTPKNPWVALAGRYGVEARPVSYLGIEVRL